MVVQSFGIGILTLLMRADRARDQDTSWLLFGPSDEAVVEAPAPEEDYFRHAAE